MGELHPRGKPRGFKCLLYKDFPEGNVKYPLSVAVENGFIKSVQTSSHHVNKASGDFELKVTHKEESLMKNIFNIVVFINLWRSQLVNYCILK